MEENFTFLKYKNSKISQDLTFSFRRALAESSARDIKETSEKVIIYKPTYQYVKFPADRNQIINSRYCADNERLKWKLDLAEARLRRKEREAQLVTSDFEEERSLFEEKRSKRKNSKKAN